LAFRRRCSNFPTWAHVGALRTREPKSATRKMLSLVMQSLANLTRKPDLALIFALAK
jgi:hypothetical protein